MGQNILLEMIVCDPVQVMFTHYCQTVTSIAAVRVEVKIYPVTQFPIFQIYESTTGVFLGLLLDPFQRFWVLGPLAEPVPDLRFGGETFPAGLPAVHPHRVGT
jgi:hypothetical protein